ncbi:MAG: phosphate ABC transporter permease subunit PstC [Planctomycetes bacterium]|nr:phosphate ABC transporter permease subunit PstC [Planctomycetota bacterium]
MTQRPARVDRSGRVVVTAMRCGSILTVSILLLIIGFVLSEAWPALIGIGPRFLTDESWHPTEGTFGAGPMLVGSLLTTAGAVAIAVPLGVLTAVYWTYHAPSWVAPPLRICVELLAGVPSVVFGLWGLVVIVPWILEIRPPGQCLLAASIVLASMIVPTITLLTEQALRELPRHLAANAAALGLCQRTTIWRILVPQARRSIGVAALLATARALGETMAVLLVCGNAVAYPSSPFDSIRTLTTGIALEMAYALGEHRAALFACGF